MTKDHSFDCDTPVGKVWDGFHLNLDYVLGDHRRLLRTIARATDGGRRRAQGSRPGAVLRYLPRHSLAFDEESVFRPCWDVILP